MDGHGFGGWLVFGICESFPAEAVIHGRDESGALSAQAKELEDERDGGALAFGAGYPDYCHVPRRVIEKFGGKRGHGKTRVFNPQVYNPGIYRFRFAGKYHGTGPVGDRLRNIGRPVGMQSAECEEERAGNGLAGVVREGGNFGIGCAGSFDNGYRAGKRGKSFDHTPNCTDAHLCWQHLPAIMGIMYEISVEADFAAAHFLSDYHGKCERLHGHNYRVVAHARGAVLDSGGMLVDFGVLKKALRDACAALDHSNLNDREVFAANPSAERIARYIFEAVAAAAPDIPLYAVDVYETPTNRARYFGADML